MIRATTPKHSFIFDIDPEENFKKILITYSQNGNVIFEKTKEDLTFEQGVSCVGETEYIASFRLTQEETKMFTISFETKRVLMSCSRFSKSLLIRTALLSLFLRLIRSFNLFIPSIELSAIENNIERTIKAASIIIVYFEG